MKIWCFYKQNFIYKEKMKFVGERMELENID